MPPVERNSHYITPTRLVKNPHFHKSIKMLQTVSPEFKIVLPQATVEWLHHHWSEITPENVALCEEHSDYRLRMDWDNHPDVATKVHEFILTSHGKNMTEYMESKHLRELFLTKFIEEELTPHITSLTAKIIKDKQRTWRGEEIKALDWTPHILSNKSLKTYQLELVWKAINQTDTMSFYSEMFRLRPPLEIVPDYIFKTIFNVVIEEPGTDSSYDSRNPSIFREAMKRGMLVKTTPAIATIPSQPKPIPLTVVPVVPVVPVTPVSPAAVVTPPKKLIPMLPGRLYYPTVKK